MYTPTADMLSDLKMLLGINDSTKDAELTMIMVLTAEKTLNTTNQSTLPGALELLVVEMSSDAYRLNAQANGSAAGDVSGSISSVSDNGQSVSYRENSYQAVLKSVMTVLKDYETQLARWRKPGW